MLFQIGIVLMTGVVGKGLQIERNVLRLARFL